MELSLSTAFITVGDPDAALAFYRDGLGLSVYNDVARENYRWITLGSPTQPGVSVVLSNYVAGSPEDNEAVAALVAKGALNGAHFKAEDLEAAFTRAKEAGAEVVSEPAEQPWGARDFAVRDPSGNLIRVNG